MNQQHVMTICIHYMRTTSESCLCSNECTKLNCSRDLKAHSVCTGGLNARSNVAFLLLCKVSDTLLKAVAADAGKDLKT